MKIEIDLNDILRDEHGDGESLAESIRRQVVETLVRDCKTALKKRIDEETAAAINAALRTAVVEQMPALVADLMNAEYQPVNRYGSRSQVTTFRAELIKSIHEQMVYKRDSDKNAFTKAVDQTVGENMAAFKAEFGKQVTGAFIAQAMAHATAEMKKRLGITS
jgi:hypothetical protein